MANGSDDRSLSGIGDILKGFGKLINTVVDMAEKDVHKKCSSGDLFKPNDERGLKGTYDFQVKLGLNDKDTVGLQRKPDIVTPQADVFRENDQIIVILEMSDITLDEFSCRIDGSMLLFEGNGAKAVYTKKIDLGDFETDIQNITVSENNGIFKVIIKRGGCN